MFFGNINFWKVRRFVGFSKKKLLQYFYLFRFYVVLNTVFTGKVKFIWKAVIFGCFFFLKKHFLYLKEKQ